MYKINTPVKVLVGKGEITNLKNIAKEYGSKAFLVYDPFLKDSDLIKDIVRGLESNEVSCVEFNEIVPNPTTYLIDKGIKMAVDSKCDFVIAIGGGSAIDSAKAIALVSSNGGSCWEYVERFDREVKRPTCYALPIIAIPTTSGTGAECTPYSIISNPDTKEKGYIGNEKIYPKFAILDSELVVSKPPQLTALTGIDAFSHAFEAYTGKHADPYLSILALESIKLFAENIKECVDNGTNIVARENMQLSCLLAGMAMANVGTTIPHALGQPLSGLYNAPHGGSIAACIIQVIRWTLPECLEKYAKVAELFDPSIKELSVKERAYKLPELLDKLFKSLGVVVTFGDYGLKEAEVERFVNLVYDSYSGNLESHIKVPTKQDLLNIVRQCL